MPATVQAVLAARIDRLPPEREAAAPDRRRDRQGRAGRAAAGRRRARRRTTLRRGLAALQAAEFLYEASLFPELEYTFKHALTHEVAYGSLLQERRKALHARVVEAIERLYADRLDEHVERLAHHALRAERWEKPSPTPIRRVSKALGRSAYREALSWFEQALDGAASTFPRVATTQELAVDLRLELRQALGVARRARSGARVPARGRDARQCARRSSGGSAGVYAAMVRLLRRLGRYDEAVEAGQRALTLAERRRRRRPLHAYATFHLGAIYRDRGDFVRRSTPCV